MIDKEYEIDDELVEEATGGHALSAHRYLRCGIKTEYHVFGADEFTLPDGTVTNEEGANNYVISIVGQEKFDHWKRKHAHKHSQS